MNYSNLMEAQRDEVYLKGVATKILQHMDRIRNVSDLSRSRRWVMELIQNARDLAYPEEKVKIRIELSDNTLKFMHSGKPFRVQDILSIVNQVSSKGGDDSFVGQFGTGFMSTYQLSEQVDIDSILADTYEGVPLPPKKFHITLDRQGHDVKEILSCISQNMNDLRDVDNGSETSVDPNAFNTVFTYHLNTADSLDAARTGVEDLKHTILFIMLFSRHIKSIEILADNTETLYERIGEKTLSGGLKYAEIICQRGQDRKNYGLVYCEDGKLSAAALIDGNNRFIPLSPKTSRLFIDFPLIGAESFPFPVVINDIEFKPNEPRSGITLVDNERSVDAKINKAIMQRAVKLYGEMINTAKELGFSGFENIISSPSFKNDKEISEAWFTENVSKRLCEIISAVPIIPTQNGFKSLSDGKLRLISYKTEKQARLLKELTAPLKECFVPNDTINWAAAFKSYSVAPEKIISAEKLCNDAVHYVDVSLDRESCTVSKWCSALYSAALEETELGMKIHSGEYAIFPDQEQKTGLHNIKSIYIDRDIPEVIKQICDRLDEAGRDIHIRSRLLSAEFSPQDTDQIPVYEASKIKSYISDMMQHYFFTPADRNQKFREAVLLMLACEKNGELYNILKRIYPDKLPEKTDVGDFYDENTWFYANKDSIDIICGEIEKYSTLDTLSEAIKSESSDDTMQWLNSLLKYDVGVERRIYPNIYGNLICALLNKSGNIFQRLPSFNAVSEPLLRILEKIYPKGPGYIYDFEYIFDRRMQSDLLPARTLTDEHFSVKINNAVKSCMNSQALGESPENIQQACTMLLNYITKNPDKAWEYFPDFASEENRMKLLTPNEAVKMSDKANALDGLMKKYNMDDVEEIEKIISQKQQGEYQNGGFNQQWDCGFAGIDVSGMSRKDLEAFCRKVGTEGELFVFNDVCDSLEKAGWALNSKDGHTAVFKNGAGDSAEVFRPDSSSYHQCGWDIRIGITREASKELYYIEVKTHTSNSAYKGEINLSREQFSMLTKNKANYIIAMAEYNKAQDKCVNSIYYKDIFGNMGEGSILVNSGILLYVK